MTALLRSGKKTSATCGSGCSLRPAARHRRFIISGHWSVGMNSAKHGQFVDTPKAREVVFVPKDKQLRRHCNKTGDMSNSFSLQNTVRLMDAANVNKVNFFALRRKEEKD